MRGCTRGIVTSFGLCLIVALVKSRVPTLKNVGTRLFPLSGLFPLDTYTQPRV